MRIRTMKKFSLSFESLSRTDPHGATVEVIAQKETDARAMIARHEIAHITDGNVWLNPKKALCISVRRTRQKTPEVLRVTMH